MSVKIIIIVSVILFIRDESLQICNTQKGCQFSQNQKNIDKKIQKQNTMTFSMFKKKFSKHYDSIQEQAYRMQIFFVNQFKIQRHNQYSQQYKMAINQFADLSPSQFSNIYTTTYPSNKLVSSYAKKIVHFTEKNWEESINITLEEIKNIITILQETKENKKSIDQEFIDQSYQLKIKNKKKPYKEQIEKFDQQKQNQSIPINFSNLWSHSRKVGQTSPKNQQKLENISINGVSNKHQSNDGIYIDWTSYSGQVRYQGRCGACYTFATSDTIAAINAIQKFRFFIPLSTQQVLDCSKNGLTYGCKGGFLEGAYAYMQVNGITIDYIYPYVNSQTRSVSDQKCLKQNGEFKVSYIENIQKGNCEAIINRLKKNPISIGIAGYRLQFYKSGVFNDCNNYIDHAVVLIGFKRGIGWKIKNSWGKNWGQNGYAWIKEGNICSICEMAVVPYI